MLRLGMARGVVEARLEVSSSTFILKVEDSWAVDREE
jgi:hypothetical protein